MQWRRNKEKNKTHLSDEMQWRKNKGVREGKKKEVTVDEMSCSDPKAEPMDQMRRLCMQLSDMLQVKKSKDLWYCYEFHSKFSKIKMGIRFRGNRSHDRK
jgi:hypothetical protein